MLSQLILMIDYGDKVHKCPHFCPYVLFSTLNFFFDFKISLTFTFVVIHVPSVKKSHNQTGKSATYKIFNGRFNH